MAYVIELRGGRRISPTKTVREVYAGPTGGGSGAKFTTEYHKDEWIRFETYQQAVDAIPTVVRLSGCSINSLTIKPE